MLDSEKFIVPCQFSQHLGKSTPLNPIDCSRRLFVDVHGQRIPRGHLNVEANLSSMAQAFGSRRCDLERGLRTHRPKRLRKETPLHICTLQPRNDTDRLGLPSSR